jgi:hypothetical protein
MGKLHLRQYYMFLSTGVEILVRFHRRFCQAKPLVYEHLATCSSRAMSKASLEINVRGHPHLHLACPRCSPSSLRGSTGHQGHFPPTAPPAPSTASQRIVPRGKSGLNVAEDTYR